MAKSIKENGNIWSLQHRARPHQHQMLPYQNLPVSPPVQTSVANVALNIPPGTKSPAKKLSLPILSTLAQHPDIPERETQGRAPLQPRSHSRSGGCLTKFNNFYLSEPLAFLYWSPNACLNKLSYLRVITSLMEKGDVMICNICFWHLLLNCIIVWTIDIPIFG